MAFTFNNTANVNDNPTFLLDGASATTTAYVNGTTYV